jgi:hypothetical protein
MSTVPGAAAAPWWRRAKPLAEHAFAWLWSMLKSGNRAQDPQQQHQSLSKKKQHQIPTPKQSAVWLSGFAPLSFCFAEKFFSKELVPLSVGSSNEAEANDKRCIASYSVM